MLCFTLQCLPLPLQTPTQRYLRGAYKCECRQGYEYPFNDLSWFFDGQMMEEEYNKMLRGEPNRCAFCYHNFHSRHFLIGFKMFLKLVLTVATVWGHKESPASSCVSTDFILRLARLDLNRRDAMFLFYWILQLFTFSSRYDTLKCRIAGASSVTINWLLLSLSFFLYLWNRS